jgi:hypothetical protein
MERSRPLQAIYPTFWGSFMLSKEPAACFDPKPQVGLA